MTFVCIVCRELLTNHPHNEERPAGAAGGVTPRPKRSMDIVSTKCGHMYHLICLDNWFNKQANPRQECPYCKSAVVTRDYQRIFPIGDEESEEIETRLERAKEMQEETAVLKNEIQQFESILEETGSQLQDKTLALDILQYEFNEKVGEVVACKEENKLLKDTVEALKTEAASLGESHRKEKLGWDRKVGEVTRKVALLQAELNEERRKSRADESKNPLNTTTNHHDLLLAEIQALKGHMFNMTLSPTLPTPKRSMASQTDFPPMAPDSLIDSMSRMEMLDVCMKFLEKEKAHPSDRDSPSSTHKSQSGPTVRSELHRTSSTPANIRSTFKQAVQEAATAAAPNHLVTSESNVNQNHLKQENRRPVAAKRSLTQQPGCQFFPEDNPLGAAGGAPSLFNFTTSRPYNQDFIPTRYSYRATDEDHNNCNPTASLPHMK